ncbi:MAG: hypothetical protein FJ404_02845 [Verrucomicrobia bacterium]|nr:hypothetical protein [Verrucomicrobiota bacterium]
MNELAMDDSRRPDTERRIRRRAWMRRMIFALPVLAAGQAFLLEPTWLKLRWRRTRADTPRHRFVHCSDLHHKGDANYLSRIVAAIHSVSPDFVCFTGDWVEESKHLDEALGQFQSIGVPLFGVPGNHDYWSNSDFQRVESVLAKTGGGWLMDRSMPAAGGRVLISGASCKHSWTPPTPAGVRHLFLMHYPSWADQLMPAQYDLLLAGHSHGGQVRLPLYGALILPGGVGKYELGMYQTPAGPLHVSPGLGWFHWAVRFNCRPEVTVFEI